MRADAILREAAAIKKSIPDLSDPVKFCREAGVILLYSPMGSFKGACKGFILSECGHTAVTVNSDLEEIVKNTVIYHEMAHYYLHVRTGMGKAYQDFLTEDRSAGMEYEANLLAAELMLEDEAVLGTIKEAEGFYEAAAQLWVMPEMLDMKLRMMDSKGYCLPAVPVRAEACFLKD